MSESYTAVGMVEFNSIAAGIDAADQMVKTAQVDPLFFKTICPGKFVAAVTGDVAAVSASVNKILGALVAAYDSVATVSSMMHGEYGIEDVCISTMTIIGPNGVKGKVPVELTYDEQAKLRASADALKEVIASLDI